MIDIYVMELGLGLDGFAVGLGLKFYFFELGFAVYSVEYIVLGWKGRFVTAGVGCGFMEGMWLLAPQFRKLCLYWDYRNDGASRSMCS